MSDVVFILGAGASRDSGAPLMNDFLDTASHLLLTQQLRGEETKAQFRRVFEAIGALQVVHSKAQLDLNNIESIFTVLELGNVIRRVPGVESDEIDTVIAALKTLIVATLEQQVRFPVESRYIMAPRPYPRFAEVVKHLTQAASPVKTVSVITFNYDVAADVALYREGLGPNYGLDGAATPPNQVDLLKLHGSLNWAEEVGTKVILPLHPHAYLSRYQVSGFNEVTSTRLPFSEQLQRHFGTYEEPARDVLEEAVIVPPSWNKADYHRALSNIWARAAKHLSEAQYIFICGYSLPETDSFFRHLYALGSVGVRPLQKFVVFNPDSSGQTNERFRRLLGLGALARYEYRAETFGSALEYVQQLFPRLN